MVDVALSRIFVEVSKERDVVMADSRVDENRAATLAFVVLGENADTRIEDLNGMLDLEKIANMVAIA